MIPVLFDYATPSAFESDRQRQLLGLSPNRRRPVRFHGRLREQIFPLRIFLQALGEVIWSDDSWRPEEEFQFQILDPVITVHPDRVFFEAFSQDQSAYGCLIADRSIFETSGEVLTGTTNVDFTGWLWSALSEMRSSRETWLRVEPEGFEVQTTGAGGRFEAKVDLPDEWVRGFLQLMGAMAMPGTRLAVRPVDLLAAVRFLSGAQAKVSPRALRYEFHPQQPAQIVLEPFEEVILLRNTEHNYDEPRIVRTWGRRRLKLLEPLLPYADSVDIYLKGRALPSFYAVRVPHLTFLLGLSGWTAQRWTESGSFDLLGGLQQTDEALLDQLLEHLRRQYALDERQAAEVAGVSLVEGSQALAALCRRGLAIYDVEARCYRHRELFETPIDEARLYPADPRREAAAELCETGRVIIERCDIRETKKKRKLKTPQGKVERNVVYRDWEVVGSAADLPANSTKIIINDSGRIIFGTCGCAFFRENLMNRGPCEHMLALHQASQAQRQS